MQRRTQYAKLYEVEKLCGIVQQNNELFVEIKWRGWGDHKTKQPVARIAENPTWRDDIQRMLEEHEQTKMANIVNLKKKTKEYVLQYKAELFDEYRGITIKMDGPNGIEEELQNKNQAKEQRLEGRKDGKKTVIKKSRNQESIQEKVRCKIAARNKLIHSIKYGLRDLAAEDFFSLSSLYNQCQAHLQYLMASKTIPLTDFEVQEIKGLIRVERGYQFCICLKCKVYTCTLEEMKRYYPRKLVYFLSEFLKYMKTYFGPEILKQEQLLKKNQQIQKQMYKVQKFKKIRLQQEYRKRVFYFGNNERDAAINQTNYTTSKWYYTIIRQEIALKKKASVQKSQKNLQNKSPNKRGRKKKQVSVKSNEFDGNMIEIVENPFKHLHDDLMIEMEKAGFKVSNNYNKSQMSSLKSAKILEEKPIEKQKKQQKKSNKKQDSNLHSSSSSKNQLRKKSLSKKQQKIIKSDSKSRKQRSLVNLRVPKKQKKKVTKSNRSSKNNSRNQSSSEQFSAQINDCSTPLRSSQRLKQKREDSSKKQESKDNIYSSESFHSSDEIPVKRRKE